MKELEWQIPEGSLFYVRHGSGAEITRYNGLAGQVVIPVELPLETGTGSNGEARLGKVSAETGAGSGENERAVEPSLETGVGSIADAQPADVPCGRVTSVAKKAFLSKKYLRSVAVPAGVEEVGDWAFAYCDALREISFAGREVRFGKDVFKECRNLRCVRFDEGETCEGTGALVAAAVTQMDASYLLNSKEAGSSEWLEKWDARMLAILRAADDEGYSKQILCGEEDYESADLETYLKNSRKKKVRLLLLRLYWSMGLDPALQDQLKKYLLAHSKGCRTDETWQVIRDECGDRREFYELFARLGCLTRENAPLVIAETREDCPEMKAFFLKYQADHFAQADYFADMEL
ncbi:MAG: leucine-rich repeat protein [Lachnospiraceae bacterium]|nr:leucine-rich repeat protein [Lachnospiraceae bacterium]